MGSDQTVNSQQSTGKFVAEKSAIENDLEAEKECDILCAEAVSFWEIANEKIRAKLIRPPGTEMDEIRRHSLFWRLFLASSMQAAIFLNKIVPRICAPSEIQTRNQLYRNCST